MADTPTPRAEGLREAAQRVVDTWEAYTEAHADRHPGPHVPEKRLDGDCGLCTSAKYGTEVEMVEYAMPVLRAALAASPTAPGLDVIAGLILGLPEPTPSDGEIGRWYVEGWRAMRRDLLDLLASEDRTWPRLTQTASATASDAGGASSLTVKTTTTSDAASPTAPGLCPECAHPMTEHQTPGGG